MKWVLRMVAPWVSALAALSALSAQIKSPPRRNVVLIVTDGLRWQEVFGGADSTLLNEKYGGVEDTLETWRSFWRPTEEARREALMPFVWGVVARQGQIYGNQNKGSVAQVTNGFKFSYPGYNEMLTGAPDPRINSNEFGPNPNVTVFEWLSHRPGFAGSVAAFGTWDAFADIFNRDRARFYVHAAWEVPFPQPANSRQVLLNELYASMTRIWGHTYMSFDALMAPVAKEYVTVKKPRALYLGFGETDEWAHDGRYDHVLETAHAVDHYIEDLWNTMQKLPQYRGQTTFIITTDHGRGSGLDGWKDHDVDVDGAENIWIAMIGPGIPPLGVRSGIGRVTQSQIAATVAAAVGEDFAGSVHGVAPALQAGSGAAGQH